MNKLNAPKEGKQIQTRSTIRPQTHMGKSDVFPVASSLQTEIFYPQVCAWDREALAYLTHAYVDLD